MSGNRPRLRRAVLTDVDGLSELIVTSARGLSGDDYTPEQVEGALRGAFGVDTQLIRDGSYFVIEQQGRFAACGGWSRRRTLFGSDARAGRDAGLLDPEVDAAKIRAFFVHPGFARRGLGTLLLERCEREAAIHGFRRLEMMATLPGVRLYAARGYQAAERVAWPLGDGLSIPFVRMHKTATVPSPRIERATMADAAEILELQKLAYESEARLYQDWNLPPLKQSVESMREDIAAMIVLCAREGSRLVGSVRGRVEDGVGHVGRLVVHPEVQGQGIGTLLMRHIESALPTVRRFELFTGSRSEGNLRLYERLGYTRSREQALSSAVTLAFLEKPR